MTSAAADPCAGCARLEDDSTPRVSLACGRVVSTWCDCWRDECAARHREAVRILGLPTREIRRAVVDRVRERDGDLAADRLAAEVRRLHAARHPVK